MLVYKTHLDYIINVKIVKMSWLLLRGAAGVLCSLLCVVTLALRDPKPDNSFMCEKKALQAVQEGNSSGMIVEICYMGQWRRVCRDDDSTILASAVCKQMLYSSGVLVPAGAAYNGQLVVVELDCPSVDVPHTSNCTVDVESDDDCSSGQQVEILCSNSYLSFLPPGYYSANGLFLANRNSPRIEVNSSFVPNIPYYTDQYFNMLTVFPNGVMVLGPRKLPTPRNLSINLSVVAPFWIGQGEGGGLRVSVEVFEGTGQNYLSIVSSYISNRTNSSFHGDWLTIVDWDKADTSSKALHYQALLISDHNTTYAVYTYKCSMNLPNDSLALIGTNIPSKNRFRYSRLNFTSRVGCLNGNQQPFYNLFYELTGPGSIYSSYAYAGSCVDAGFSETSCCQPLTDPSQRCRVVSGDFFCFCDGLCIERGDCCFDINNLTEINTCIPTCIENTIRLINQSSSLQVHSYSYLQICASGVWQSVCDESWTNSDAMMTCQLMGFDDGIGNVMGYVCSMFSQGASDNFCCHWMRKCFRDSFSYSNSCIIKAKSRLIIVHNFAISSLGPNLPVSFDYGGITSVDCSNEGSTAMMCQYNRTVGDTCVGKQLTILECTAGVPTINPIIPSLPAATNSTSAITLMASAVSSRIRVTSTSNNDASLTLTTSIHRTAAVHVSSTPVLAGQSNVSEPVIITVSVCMVVLLVAVLGAVTAYLVQRRKMKNKQAHELAPRVPHRPALTLTNDYIQRGRPSLIKPEHIPMVSDKFLILNKQLRLIDPIGQGGFGVVYKAHFFDDCTMTIVAVKTLKGTFDEQLVHEMIEESVKMKTLVHPNVISLLGVCLDGGPAPFLVLPYMENGCVLDYLKQNRSSVLLGCKHSDDEVTVVQKKLLTMCLQIAKGMEYLAGLKLVHRDLAARNCMIDEAGIIKVADFGLAKSTYEKLYFRQDKGEPVKLPIKWMAIESIEDGVFSEKSDVWSFGITCWEVFNGGRIPYGGITPLSLPSLLQQGHRMDRPFNAACSDNIYQVMMMHCWNAETSKRPSFSLLVKDIDMMVSAIAGYLTMGSLVSDANTMENQHAD